MNFKAELPTPYSASWRESYRYTSKDEPRLSSYQAPGGKPVAFTYKTLRLGGGQSVDTAEFPFFGYWSNNPLNEKPQQITVTGYISGENYIEARNALVEAIQQKTSDDSCGYLDMPLWGRFPVVVTEWNVEEANNANGKADLSITFTRAGFSEESRVSEIAKSVSSNDIQSATDALKKAAADNFIATVAGKCDTNTLVAGFRQVKNTLTNFVGRVQGVKTALNSMVNKVNSITNLIAQGIRTPAELVQALISACFGIAAGVLEIYNAGVDMFTYFSRFSTSDKTNSSSGSNAATESTGANQNSDDATSGTTEIEQFVKNNAKNTLMNFLSAVNFSIDCEAITENQQVTKNAVENLYRTIAFAACAQLLPELSATTYNQQTGLWSLFERLENSLKLEDVDVFKAVEDTRIATAQMLLAKIENTKTKTEQITFSKNAAVEMRKEISQETPILALALVLGCDADRIRTLNRIADSFLIKGSVVYV